MPREECDPSVRAPDHHHLRPRGQISRSIGNVTRDCMSVYLKHFHLQNSTHLNIADFMKKSLSWKANTVKSRFQEVPLFYETQDVQI